jgi:hypothetical protein
VDALGSGGADAEVACLDSADAGAVVDADEVVCSVGACAIGGDTGSVAAVVDVTGDFDADMLDADTYATGTDTLVDTTEFGASNIDVTRAEGADTDADAFRN